jgi:hypothetical protein
LPARGRSASTHTIGRYPASTSRRRIASASSFGFIDFSTSEAYVNERGGASEKMRSWLRASDTTAGCTSWLEAHASHDARSARTGTSRKRARRAASSGVTWYSPVSGLIAAKTAQPGGSVYSCRRRAVSSWSAGCWM